MQRVDAKVLQTAIDALLARPAGVARDPSPMAPTAGPKRRRRVRFNVKYVYSIPHRDDDGREPPTWTLFPASMFGQGDVDVFNDSDEEVEERVYTAQLDKQLHIAAVHRLVNRRDDSSESESESEGEGEGEGESESEGEAYASRSDASEESEESECGDSAPDSERAL